MRVRFGDCVFDNQARELWRGARRVDLSPKAFQLLALLIAERPRALSHGELRDALWPDAHVGYTSLARVVTEVRKALAGAAGRPTFVRTHARYGYAFTAPVTPAPAGAESARFFLVTDDREFPLPEGETLVGRGEECGVRLPSSQVSRIHARLQVQGNGILIEDRGSKNGTWINGARITAPLDLDDGDEVLVGDYRLLVRSASMLDSTRTATPR